MDSRHSLDYNHRVFNRLRGTQRSDRLSPRSWPARFSRRIGSPNASHMSPNPGITRIPQRTEADRNQRRSQSVGHLLSKGYKRSTPISYPREGFRRDRAMRYSVGSSRRCNNQQDAPSFTCVFTTRRPSETLTSKTRRRSPVQRRRLGRKQCHEAAFHWELR